MIDYVNLYRRELAGFFANSTASTQATGLDLSNSRQLHVVRLAAPVNPDVLTAYAHRLSSNRGNPYPVPGWMNGLAGGLSVFHGGLCTSNPQPTHRARRSIPLQVAALKTAYYTSTPGGPPCKVQSRSERPPVG